MAAYYNEIEPYAAQWLRNLIAKNLIAPGDVDERSIVDVQADDLRGYTQCHFFAGIGGWSVALRSSMWGDDRPVWTGSCPCQPFSSAGRQKGHGDERHLWPNWFRLIRECRPATVFGEQVASAITFGWLDEIAHDLEAENYAIASAVLPACSVGKPHKRDRLWFVADSHRTAGDLQASGGEGVYRGGASSSERRSASDMFGYGGGFSRTMGNPISTGLEGFAGHGEGFGGGRCRTDQLPRQIPLAHTISQRGCSGDSEGQNAENADASSEGIEWIDCPDGKRRPTEPSICLLAHGVSARASKLRAYGNAIVPQVAAQFIKAYGECLA